MGHAVRVAPFSQVFLAEEQGGGDGPIRVRHVAGAVWVAVTPGPAPATRVEVESGPATVDVRGTGASLTLLRDGSLLVRVYHGEAALRGPGREARWRRILRGGQEALVGPAGAAPEPRALVRDAAEAGWVRWNEEQDAAGGYGAASPR
jgi:ferric-dicitrate binding protein FerR (iron transport regulator)